MPIEFWMLILRWGYNKTTVDDISRQAADEQQAVSDTFTQYLDHAIALARERFQQEMSI